jgi:mRNA interferase HigB
MTAPRATTAQSRLALAGGMHVISRKRLKEAVTRHGDLEAQLDAWFRIVKRADWKNLAEVRKTFSSADVVGKWTIFNIKGNRYRLITEINYSFGRIYIRHVLTHAEYDRGIWKL